VMRHVLGNYRRDVPLQHSPSHEFAQSG
jgi:hypothetical protein